jgi:hypothetical protein
VLKLRPFLIAKRLLAEVENSVLLLLLDFYINKKTKKFNAFPFEQALNFFVE